MRAALFSKSRDEKQRFASEFVRDAKARSVIYVYPKNRRKEKLDIPGTFAVSFEDVTKCGEWLRVNALAGPDTALILENPSRYPKITSEKFRHLYRLAMQVGHRAILDIVPFTLDVQYLYTPFCYLGRDILGYAHYYAFRENYYEMNEDGTVRSAHDADVLAMKIASVSKITYDSFLCRDRTMVKCPTTAAERDEYAAKKAELFAKYKSPQRIVTRLADTTHAFPSRMNALLELLSKLEGRTVVYTNLGTYAKRAREAAQAAGVENSARFVSYQTGAIGEFDNCIYLESPIVKTYFLLDAESRLPAHCRVFHFLSDAKVDLYLYGELDHELQQIDGLTRELSKIKNGGSP